MENENQTNQVNENLSPEALASINIENAVPENPSVVQDAAASNIETPAAPSIATPAEIQEMPKIEVPTEESNAETNVASNPTNSEAMPEIEVPVEQANPVVNETPAPVVTNENLENATPAPTLSVDPDVYQANVSNSQAAPVAPAITSEPVSTPSVETPAPTLAIDPALQAQTPVDEPVKEEPGKVKKSKKGLIIFLILLIILIGAGVFAYFKFFNLGPNDVYGKLINKYTASTEKFLKQNVNKIDTSFKNSGNIKIDSNMDGFDQLKNISLDYSLGADIDGKKMEASLNLSEDNNNLIDAAVYIVDNKLYLNSEDVYNGLLLVSDVSETFNFEEISSNFKTEDPERLINGFNNALKVALQKADYKVEKAEITIDGKKAKVTDNVMIINENNFGNIMEALLKQIKDDTKMIEALANLTSMTQNEITTMLDIKQDYTDLEQFELRMDVYTKPIINKVVGLDISINNSKILTITTKSNKNQEVYDITLLNNGEELGTGKLTKDKNSKITFTTTVDEMNINISMQNKVEDNATSNNIEATFQKGDEYLKITYEGNMSYNQALTSIDVTKAVDIDSLSEDEYANISDNLNNILYDSGLYDIIDNMENSDYLDDDFDYQDVDDTSTPTDKVPDECRYAKCNECSDNTCICTYTDTSFRQNTITCPKEFY